MCLWISRSFFSFGEGVRCGGFRRRCCPVSPCPDQLSIHPSIFARFLELKAPDYPQSTAYFLNISNFKENLFTQDSLPPNHRIIFISLLLPRTRLFQNLITRIPEVQNFVFFSLNFEELEHS